MDKLIKSIFLISILLFASCANIKPVGGGPEDTTPPTVKKSIPENNSTNYKGQTVTLEFDEYIDAQKVRESMIISPLYDGNFEVISRKKTVIIKFDKPFKDSTTYNINFGESVKDMTKGNYAKNLSIAFSTGPSIDSLILKGNAYNFLTGKPLAGISIQLYNVSDTNNILNSRPLYFSKTEGNGNFTIKNIKEGTYNVYALQDLNTNFKYDNNEKELIAYVYNVVVNKKANTIKLGLTKTDTKPPEVIGKKQEMDYYLLTISEGLETYSINSDSKKVLTDISENGKTLRIFNTFNSKDSINLYHQFTDSSGNTIKDTTKIFFKEFKAKKNENPYSIAITPKSLQLIKNDTIKIVLSKPFDKINYSNITIRKDTTLINLTEKDFLIDTNKLKISILNKYPFKDSLVVKLNKGSFISYSEDSSSALKVKFKIKKEEDYGILGGTIMCKEPVYIFQLIDSKGKIVDSKPNATKFHYTYLEPGEYQLKIIVDVNKNGRWDGTNIYKGIPPEPIKYYKEKINLRANWELLDIKFEAK